MTFSLPPALLARIETYRAQMGYEGKSETLRLLITLGLDKSQNIPGIVLRGSIQEGYVHAFALFQRAMTETLERLQKELGDPQSRIDEEWVPTKEK